jgi:hypothetical protein
LSVEPLEARRLLASGPAGDDFGSGIDQAALIVLAGDGSGTQAGVIEVFGDFDAFRFVGPGDGPDRRPAG